MISTAHLSTATLADAQAARNWTANLRALTLAQPQLIDRVQAMTISGQWVSARDGSLTLQDSAGGWLGGCSLPYRAGAAMLKTLDPHGAVLCFLAPGHAGEIKAALERLTPRQSVLVLQPDLPATRTILACEDFAGAIVAGRLFFITGADWAQWLGRLFRDHPGLSTPLQFIKLPTLPPERADPLIAGAQQVFVAVNTDRADRIRVLRDAPRPTGAPLRGLTPLRGLAPLGKLAVIAGSRFALWDDAGDTLASTLASTSAIEVRRLDPDVPLFAGPLATAEFCSTCDAMVTADVARCDFPDVLSPELPWVTWVTRGRIPQVNSACPRDALLVTDPAWRDVALKNGWDERRVGVAGFTAFEKSRDLRSLASQSMFDGWTVIADTLPVAIPKTLDEFSSHKLLWEGIEARLLRDPFALTDDIAGFLHQQCQPGGVDEATLDRRLFIEALLVPAYQQGIVRAMTHAGVPIRVWGAGWDQIDTFRPIASGPIASRDALAGALRSSLRLLHVWPTRHAHPIFATGLPVLRREVTPLDAFVRRAKSLADFTTQTPSVPPISLASVLGVLNT